MSDREDLDELISREGVLSLGSAREIVNMIVAKGWLGPADVSLLTDKIGDVEAERIQLKAEIESLERWKAEMLPVMEGLQELGKALGLRLGEQITGAAALAAVEKLKADRSQALERAADAWDYKAEADRDKGSLLVRAEKAEAEVEDLKRQLQSTMTASHRYAADREELQQEVMTLEDKVETAEVQRDEARTTRDMHKERADDAEERAEKLQADLDAIAVERPTAYQYMQQRNDLALKLMEEKARVETLETQATNLQRIVEFMEREFETLAVGYDKTHSVVIPSTVVAGDIRESLRKVANEIVERGTGV